MIVAHKLVSAIAAWEDSDQLGWQFGEPHCLKQTRDGECDNNCAELCPTTSTTRETRAKALYCAPSRRVTASSGARALFAR